MEEFINKMLNIGSSLDRCIDSEETQEAYNESIVLYKKHFESQQRELLLAYESYSANKVVGKENKRVTKQLVDDFLANNCG